LDIQEKQDQAAKNSKLAAYLSNLDNAVVSADDMGVLGDLANID